MDWKSMEHWVEDYAVQGAELRRGYLSAASGQIVAAAGALVQCLHEGGKVLICGNGGSAADAQHFAAELVNRFQWDRPALPAIALTVDTSIVTAVANDSSFEAIFARQVEALGRPGDVLVAISTSGRSPNVLAALEVAQRKRMLCLGLCGAYREAMEPLCHHLLAVPHRSTPLIQEIHITLIHLLCALVERALFPQQLSEGGSHAHL